MELNRIVHEPARLRIMMVLSGVDGVDFNFLLTALSLSRGNLSRHMEKLELAGYIKTNKTFRGRIPNTTYHLTKKGSKALTQYWEELDILRRIGPNIVNSKS
jgi:DNA-binding transcriptional ArsR family regulator